MKLIIHMLTASALFCAAWTTYASRSVAAPPETTHSTSEQTKTIQARQIELLASEFSASQPSSVKRHLNRTFVIDQKTVTKRLRIIETLWTLAKRDDQPYYAVVDATVRVSRILARWDRQAQDEHWRNPEDYSRYMKPGHLDGNIESAGFEQIVKIDLTFTLLLQRLKESTAVAARIERYQEEFRRQFRDLLTNASNSVDTFTSERSESSDQPFEPLDFDTLLKRYKDRPWATDFSDRAPGLASVLATSTDQAAEDLSRLLDRIDPADLEAIDARAEAYGDEYAENENVTRPYLNGALRALADALPRETDAQKIAARERRLESAGLSEDGDIEAITRYLGGDLTPSAFRAHLEDGEMHAFEQGQSSEQYLRNQSFAIRGLYRTAFEIAPSDRVEAKRRVQLANELMEEVVSFADTLNAEETEDMGHLFKAVPAMMSNVKSGDAFKASKPELVDPELQALVGESWILTDLEDDQE